MTNDSRTTDEIERDIVDERARMSSSINTLQKKFSVEAIVGDLGDMLRDQGGDLGRAVSQTVGRNPAAVALVGVGLAWLFLGKDRNSSNGDTNHLWGGNDLSRRDRGQEQTWDRHGMTSGSQTGRRSDPHASWYDTGENGQGRKDGAWRSSREDISASTTERWDDLKGGGGVSGAIQGAAHAVGDAVSGAASTVSDAASDLSQRLSHGLEDLSDEARSRVLAARRAAHDARLASSAAMQKGVRAASNFFEDQPLVVGALAVAVGAALGGVLPHSRIEDDTMGASSDELFAEAQRLFREEREKAMGVMRMAATAVEGEIRDVGSEIADSLPEGKNAGEVIVDRATETAHRIYDRAVDGLENEEPDTSRV